MAKHRGEPKVVHRVYFLESESGWGRDEWHNDYDTSEDAKRAYLENQPKPGPAPDYYLIATAIEKITL